MRTVRQRCGEETEAEPLNQRVKSLSAAWARHSMLCKFAMNRFRCANHIKSQDSSKTLSGIFNILILLSFFTYIVPAGQ